MAKRTFRSGIFSVMLVPSLCALGAAISFSACADDYVVTIEEGDDVTWLITEALQDLQAALNAVLPVAALTVPAHPVRQRL